MERRKKVERRIQPAKPIEDHAQPTGSLRPREGETQREQNKEGACYENGCGHSPAVNAQRPSLAKEERRAATKKRSIDR